MIRRIRRRIALAAALALGAAGAAEAQTSVQQLILYKNAQQPLLGNVAADWRPASNAYTAQTVFMPFDRLKADGASIEWAQLLIVFQALSPWSNVGVGMFACPGLANAAATDISEVCPHWAYFAANDVSFANYTPGCLGTGPGPHPCWLDVTTTLNKMIDEGTPLYLTTGTFGNGVNGPNVYDVEIEVIWSR